MLRSIKGVYDLENGQVEIQSKGTIEYQSEKTMICLCGETWISSRTRKNDLQEVEGQFWISPVDLTKALKGIYILLIYQKKDHILYVYHDRYSSPLNFYYTQNQRKVYLGTVLKQVLLTSDIHREINEDELPNFVMNGFIYGEQTLIKNMYQLKTNHMLLIDREGIQQRKCRYLTNQMDEEEAMSRWEPTLEAIIKEKMPADEDIFMMLSAGYDSNYILHTVNRLRKTSTAIQGLSVGGSRGVNETDTVRENIQSYKNVRLTTKVIDESDLDSFPDIVWRLEGTTYERGVFLQYQVGTMMKNCGAKSILCGEGADQIMRGSFYDAEYINQKNGRLNRYKTQAYPVFTNMILKKNGIIGNSFDYESKYPYLDDAFIDVAFSLAGINMSEKLYHKSVCREKLKKEITERMKKEGGATDGQAFFDSKQSMKRLYRLVEQSNFYKRYEKALTKVPLTDYGSYEKRKQRLILSSMIHGKFSQLKQLLWRLEEQKIQRYLLYLYLVLFDNLIVSGQYDQYFDCDGISFTINQII